MSIFQVLAGEYQGKAAEYNPRSIAIEFMDPKLNVWGKIADKTAIGILKLTDITSLELVESKLVNKGDAATFSAVGAMLGGPIGMAIGAGLGRIQRPCTFFIIGKNGKEHIFEGQKMWYDLIAKQQRIVSVNNKS